jgi:hypothetical protein
MPGGILNMANIEYTFLTSDNPELFDEVTRDLTFKMQDSVDRKPGEMFIQTAWGVPHEEIKALSSKHPDMVFLAEYSYESQLYDTNYCVEYKDGSDELVNLKHGYLTPANKSIRKKIPCYEELLEKVYEVFRRVDPVIDDPENGKMIDWCSHRVEVTVELDGYKMVVDKSASIIENIQCFQAKERKEVTWQGIDEKDIPSIPF